MADCCVELIVGHLALELNRVVTRLEQAAGSAGKPSKVKVNVGRKLH
ncbi:MAG TPA: hypothetical protein VNF46_06675 [Gammaproteobacteria bacterium]|nr:hypothetical protein [Gammaproteobacteria bacterium]